MPQQTLSHSFSPAHIVALNQSLKSPHDADHLTRLLKCHRLLLQWQQDGDDSTLGKLWRAYCRADVEDF